MTTGFDSALRNTTWAGWATRPNRLSGSGARPEPVPNIRLNLQPNPGQTRSGLNSTIADQPWSP